MESVFNEIKEDALEYRRVSGTVYPPMMASFYGHPDIKTDKWHLHCAKLSQPKHAIDMMRNGTIPSEYLVLTRLGENRACVMSDTPMEKYTNQYFLDEAYGDILIVGLGIGMLLPALLEKSFASLFDDDMKPITSVTIVEKDKDLIELMRPLIEKYVFEDGERTFDKFEIIEGDAYTFAKENGDKHFDWAYIDIWDEYNGYSSYLDEFEKLLDEYRLIADNVDAWGYKNALEGSDETPIEQEEYSQYLANLVYHYHCTGEISGSTYNNIMKYAEVCGG